MKGDVTVSDALERMYSTFSAVQKPKSIDGCPHCIEEKEVAALLRKKLRELTPEELAPYASSVMLTVGSREDLRYFLPRILELRIADPGWWPDLEVIFSALREADWKSWPDGEQKAITALAEAVIDSLLKADCDAGWEWEFDSWLCALGRAGKSPTQYLDKLMQPEFMPKLRQFHELNAVALSKGKLSNSFWPALARKEVVAWFVRPDVQAAVVDSYQQFYAGGA